MEAENLKLEKMKRRNELLEEASNNVKLLTEMLEVYSEDKSQDDIQTMKVNYNIHLRFKYVELIIT